MQFSKPSIFIEKTDMHKICPYKSTVFEMKAKKEVLTSNIQRAVG